MTLSLTAVNTLFCMLILCSTIISQTRPKIQDKSREQRAQELLNDKKHTFQDLLDRNPESIANAKEFFEITTDERLKERMASILLSIGETDRVYYDYLVSEAQKALNNDMPWPTVYDKSGEKVSKTVNTLSPAFLRWCAAHHQDPGVAFEAAYYQIPLAWYYLAGSGDPRAYDMLLLGLHSKNPMIAVSAGMGLAKLQDKRAVGELIAAYHRAPLETRTDFAIDLLYIPDPRAQTTAEQLLNNPAAVADFRKVISEKGKAALFGY